MQERGGKRRERGQEGRGRGEGEGRGERAEWRGKREEGRGERGIHLFRGDAIERCFLFQYDGVKV